MCTVFAESEVVSLIGQGAPREDIAYAVVDSIAGKVVTQAKKLGGSYGAACLTGGLCQTEYLPTPLPKSSARRSSRIAGALLPGPSARRSPRAGFPDNKETRSYMHGLSLPKHLKLFRCAQSGLSQIKTAKEGGRRGRYVLHVYAAGDPGRRRDARRESLRHERRDDPRRKGRPTTQSHFFVKSSWLRQVPNTFFPISLSARRRATGRKRCMS